MKKTELSMGKNKYMWIYKNLLENKWKNLENFLVSWKNLNKNK
jgi:hypothetical protein